MAFECKIAADSQAPCGARLTTFIVSYPRAIHSEIMTHKILSKSSASSRAIPTEKLIERVTLDPWVPDYIGKNQKGMQAGEELSDEARKVSVEEWLRARDNAVGHARFMIGSGVHKQVVNRLLEPWMWITVIISGTEWENFFGLRCHEAAEPHFQHLARMMRTARDASEPKKLHAGEWHLPLIDDMDRTTGNVGGLPRGPGEDIAAIEALLVKISVGRCARVSYLNHEGKRDYQADIDLHDRLMVQRPLHAAPAEHVAQAMDWPKWAKERWPCFTNLPKPGADPKGFSSPTALQTHVVGQLRSRVPNDRELGADQLDPLIYAQLIVDNLRSGNYLGFKQWRKHLADEHIGGLMP